MPSGHQPNAKPDQYDQNQTYFPNIVEDLLSGKEEWRNIQEIIKLTLKALCDVIKDQGNAIVDLEKAVTVKANKSELNSVLNTKANITDVSKAITEVASMLEEKASLDEVNVLMEDKMSKSELQYLLTNKVSIEELRTLLDAKCNTHEVNQRLQMMDSKLEQCLDDVRVKSRGYALQKDLSHVMVQLELKADLNDINESLSNKANKTTVANALHRKANKTETEELIAAKVDKKEFTEMVEEIRRDISNTCYSLITNERERAVKLEHVKELEDIILHKADKAEIDMYLSAVNTQKKDFDRRMQCIERDNSDILKTLQNEVESMRVSFIETLNRKPDACELEQLSEDIHRKLGLETVMNLINQAKSDLYISINEVKDEFIQSRKKFEDNVFERASRAELNSEKAAEELDRIKRNIETLESTRRSIEDDAVAYTKSMCDSSRKEMKNELNRVYEEIDNLRNDLSNQAKLSVLNEDFKKYQAQLSEEIKEKVDVDEVQKAITGCQNDAINRITACRKAIAESCDSLNNTFTHLLDQKADALDVDKKLSIMVTKDTLGSILKTKPDVSELQSLSEQVKDLFDIVDLKVNQNEFYNEKEKMNLVIESIENDLAAKMNIADSRELLDQKCNIDDVNKALTEVHSELDVKASSDDFESHVKTQVEINQAL
mmetsp:Transcript_24921/g.28611  ORF Transcript_24921/g.28611 Transcript_24921/m.28611 type:complete len:662 (+) Transcript_24921:102-2087(+)|eukprot:CAMPEP_0168322780 /NCGR_PEP_ID=MMETSP0213-20121227/3095_1 /TAXON_ID=151035 /ORGANISM="Euplotes harpa, Strain FSP1.4" /LENGTH=661 /DNA_ID=CAMNT_0008324737 /DNA_START=102 /DNA_END=2087 /DNA_ORIENTATION=-